MRLATSHCQGFETHGRGAFGHAMEAVTKAILVPLGSRMSAPAPKSQYLSMAYTYLSSSVDL